MKTVFSILILTLVVFGLSWAGGGKTNRKLPLPEKSIPQKISLPQKASTTTEAFIMEELLMMPENCRRADCYSSGIEGTIQNCDRIVCTNFWGNSAFDFKCTDEEIIDESTEPHRVFARCQMRHPSYTHSSSPWQDHLIQKSGPYRGTCGSHMIFEPSAPLKSSTFSFILPDLWASEETIAYLESVFLDNFSVGDKGLLASRLESIYLEIRNARNIFDYERVGFPGSERAMYTDMTEETLLLLLYYLNPRDYGTCPQGLDDLCLIVPNMEFVWANTHFGAFVISLNRINVSQAFSFSEDLNMLSLLSPLIVHEAFHIISSWRARYFDDDLSAIGPPPENTLWSYASESTAQIVGATAFEFQTEAINDLVPDDWQLELRRHRDLYQSVQPNASNARKSLDYTPYYFDSYWSQLLQISREELDTLFPREFDWEWQRERASVYPFRENSERFRNANVGERSGQRFLAQADFFERWLLREGGVEAIVGRVGEGPLIGPSGRNGQMMQLPLQVIQHSNFVESHITKTGPGAPPDGMLGPLPETTMANHQVTRNYGDNENEPGFSERTNGVPDCIWQYQHTGSMNEWCHRWCWDSGMGYRGICNRPMNDDRNSGCQLSDHHPDCDADFARKEERQENQAEDQQRDAEAREADRARRLEGGAGAPYDSRYCVGTNSSGSFFCGFCSNTGSNNEYVPSSSVCGGGLPENTCCPCPGYGNDRSRCMDIEDGETDRYNHGDGETGNSNPPDASDGTIDDWDVYDGERDFNPGETVEECAIVDSFGNETCISPCVCDRDRRGWCRPPSGGYSIRSCPAGEDDIVDSQNDVRNCSYRAVDVEEWTGNDLVCGRRGYCGSEWVWSNTSTEYCRGTMNTVGNGVCWEESGGCFPHVGRYHQYRGPAGDRCFPDGRNAACRYGEYCGCPTDGEVYEGCCARPDNGAVGYFGCWEAGPGDCYCEWWPGGEISVSCCARTDLCN